MATDGDFHMATDNPTTTTWPSGSGRSQGPTGPGSRSSRPWPSPTPWPAPASSGGPASSPRARGGGRLLPEGGGPGPPRGRPPPPPPPPGPDAGGGLGRGRGAPGPPPGPADGGEGDAVDPPGCRPPPGPPGPPVLPSVASAGGWLPGRMSTSVGRSPSRAPAPVPSEDRGAGGQGESDVRSPGSAAGIGTLSRWPPGLGGHRARHRPRGGPPVQAPGDALVEPEGADNLLALRTLAMDPAAWRAWWGEAAW